MSGNPIQPTYPSYTIKYSQLKTLMSDKALNILNTEGQIVVRIVMQKKPGEE